jgi:hypothetical protein
MRMVFVCPTVVHNGFISRSQRTRRLPVLYRDDYQPFTLGPGSRMALDLQEKRARFFDADGCCARTVRGNLWETRITDVNGFNFIVVMAARHSHCRIALLQKTEQAIVYKLVPRRQRKN